jgi:sterol 3beta-glucosyltransferase
MQLIIFTIGTQGDVQPYVALGCGLQAAGHRVRIVTHSTYQGFIENHGLAFAPAAGDPKQLLASDAGQAWLASGRNPLRGYTLVKYLLGPLTERLLYDAWQGCQGADAILFTHQSFAGSSIAEAMGVPGIFASLHPLTRTRVFPSIFTPQSWQLGPHYNWLTYYLVEQLMWLVLHKPFNRWRQKMLRLAPYPLSGPFRLSYKQKIPHLYGFSPSVVPPPFDWPDTVHVSGYWFLDPPTDWQPPHSLVDFLAFGTPPILFGFGSMSQRDAAALTAVIMETVTETNRRAILLTGWGGITLTDLPDTVYMLEQIPHAWLLPQVSLMVHHGGVGTTAACIAAGVPGVTIPFLGTQLYWSSRVTTLGIGPDPIHRRQLTAARLSAAIEQALTDQKMRRRAAELGQRIRGEDGVARAVDVIERLLQRHG